jgi:hypothetical protein
MISAYGTELRDPRVARALEEVCFNGYLIIDNSAGVWIMGSILYPTITVEATTYQDALILLAVSIADAQVGDL